MIQEDVFLFKQNYLLKFEIRKHKENVKEYKKIKYLIREIK